MLGALLLALPTMAQNAGTGDDAQESELVLTKTVSQYPDENGQYYIDICAYATGNQVTKIVKTYKPADVVIALDISSSMVREKLKSFYKVPYTKNMTYSDYQLQSLDAPGSNTKKNSPAPYYYLYNGQYYEIMSAKGGDKSANYFLQYTKDGVTYYLQPGGGSNTTMPTSATTDDNNVYKGPLYVKNGVESKSYYYAFYNDGANTYYYNNGWTTNDFPEGYSKGENEVICADANLYTESNGTYTQSTKASYTYADLTAQNYYVQKPYESDYYYAYYGDEENRIYLNPDGGTSTTMIKDKSGVVFQGTLYSKKAAEGGLNFIYVTAEKPKKEGGTETVYFVPKFEKRDNTVKWEWKKDVKVNEFPDGYLAEHQTNNPSPVIYKGDLYADAEGKTKVDGNSFTYDDLKGKTYYVKFEVDNGKDKPKTIVYQPITAVDGTSGSGWESVDKDEWTVNDLNAKQYYFTESEDSPVKVGTGTETKYNYYLVQAYQPGASQEPTYTKVQNSDNKEWKYKELNDKEYYYKDGDNYYRVSQGTAGLDLSEYANNNYFLYVIVDDNGQKKVLYLYGDSASDTPTPVNAQNQVIYSGDIYSNTRLVALQVAAGEFLRIIEEKTKGPDGEWNTDDDVANNVSLILYADAAFYNSGLKDVTADNVNAWINELNSHPGYTGTDHAETMEKAYNTLKAAYDADTSNGRIQTLVFFTDGESYQKGNGNNNQRVGVANTALDYGNKLKELGIPTYVVSLLSEAVIEQFQWLPYFLKWLSSNYEYNKDGYKITSNDVAQKDGWSSNGGTIQNSAAYDNKVIDGGNYYLEYTESNNLSDIFESLSEKIDFEGEGTSVELTETSLIAVDVMSSYFKLPDGASLDNVEISIQHCTGKDSNGNLTFGASQTVPQTVTIRKAGATEDEEVVINPIAKIVGDKEIDVAGFDYGTLYCGMHGDNYDGYKLIFRFPIVIDPANPGGANLYTNEATSGIYTAKQKDGEDVIVDGFPVKDENGLVDAFEQPMVNQPNIVIVKSGLKAGHSATFLIEKVNLASGETFEPFYVTLTGKVDAEGNSVPVMTKIKLNNPGRYKVSETSWSWGYTPSTQNTWAAEKSGTDSRVAFVASERNDEGICYIIRNVSHDTEEMIAQPSTGSESGITHENLGTLFPFVNTYKNELPEAKFSEAYKVNKFYTPLKWNQGNPGAGGESGSSTDVISGGTEPGDSEDVPFGGNTDDTGGE